MAQPAITDTSGFYVFADPSYQSINLPRYNLGPSTTVGATSLYGNQIVNLDPRATGYGVSGGLGYYLPHGTLPAIFGQNVRVEIMGAYVDASATSSGSAQYATPSGGGSTFLLINNTNVIPSSYGCGLAVPCTTTSAVTSSYASWKIDGKIAGDFTFDAVTFSPSLAVFGGSSHNSQVLNLLTNNGIELTANDVYTASTKLRWTDLGLKAGLTGTVAVTNQIKLGLGGFAGIADRNTQLTGNDMYAFIGGFSPYSIGSSINIGSKRAAFLANLEARLTYQPLRNVSVSGFVGLNYDNAVPGIQAPSYAGAFLSSVIVPASINFQSETSYYAGGRIAVSFAP